MTGLVVLIPVALALGLAGLAAFFWAARSGQFEDLDGEMPLWRIPAAKMKLVVERKRDVAFEFLVPLSREAVETVKVAIAFSRGAPLIFHSVRSTRRPMSSACWAVLV